MRAHSALVRSSRTPVFHPINDGILRSFQDLLVDEAMFVPRARTYLAATVVRDPGWRTTYVLLSLPLPPRERNMFTSSNSNSLLSSLARGSLLFLPRPGTAARVVAWRHVASRRVAVLPPGRTWKKKRDAVVRAAKNDHLSLTRETASATPSSLLSRISSYEPVTICPSLSLASSVRLSNGLSVRARVTK